MVTSHNTDPSGNNTPKPVATAREVGLQDASGKDNYNAGDGHLPSPQENTFQEALLDGADFDADAYDHEGEL